MKKKILYSLGLIVALTGCNGDQQNLMSTIETAIRPPFKGVDVAFTTFTINPQQDNVLETDRGTKIKIPANALVRANNELVNEQVNINYRPFHTAAEILVSGIPMTYDSTGQSYDFVSAGMFELTADVGGEEVYVKQGETIGMSFASYKDDAAYNVYDLDEKTGEWEFIEPSIAQINEEKNEAVKTFKDAFLFNLDLDEATNLGSLEDVMWTYAGNDTETNPAENPWIFEERWRSIDLVPEDIEQALYTMQLKSSQREINISVSPYQMGEDIEALRLLNDDIVAYNEVVADRKSKELNLQIQADFVRQFEISNFGICNIDRIKIMVEQDEIFVTNAQFMIHDKLQTTPGKLVLFSGEDNEMLIREGVSWENMMVKNGANHTMMVILPNNQVAMCGQDEFEKARGKAAHNFQLSNYVTIKSMEDIEELIAQI